MEPEIPHQDDAGDLDAEALDLAQHQWLQFAPGTAASIRCRHIHRMSVATPRCIDWGVLVDAGQADRDRAILSEDTPWTRLFDTADLPTYMLITVEILSTFRYRAHQAAVPEQEDGELPPDIEFSLCGHHMDAFTQGLTQDEDGVMRA
ncbi:hypothetical protein E3N88_05815 [Mikania micrantha]|uniref:Uncharacterized protein n=1 Tax=Mikania micrantha TaxID=192012 RepID=A0A5N6PPY9_9ASTR|nr:hypothetical protein E3N88_05815 [Mikania micrantha]